MRVVPLRLCFALAAGPALAGGLGACDNWPVQPDGGSGSGPGDGDQRDAAVDCLTLTPVRASASTETNGGLCFGMALGGQALLCEPTTTVGVTRCVDSLLGYDYLLRWTGSRAIVVAALQGAEIGRVASIGNDSFELATSDGVSGICTLKAGPPAYMELCPRD
jgi:hypothetical protein